MKKATRVFAQLFGGDGSIREFHCPGRVNLIGEHIDYLGGLVMPAAISLGISAAFRPRTDKIVQAHSTAFDGVTQIDISNSPEPRDGHWSNFLIGVMRHLIEDGFDIKGFDVVFHSDLPLGSGLSSSAAMEVLLYYMLFHVASGMEPNRLKMVQDCQRIENEFIGVNCGIMDQFAVGFGKKNQAIVLDCNTLKYEYAPLPLDNHSLLIINTKKPRTLAGSAYNKRIEECDEALSLIRKKHAIDNLVDATLDDLELIADPIIRNRTRHAITEQQRVLSAKQALQQEDLDEFGKLMLASHRSLKEDYEVSCLELDHIVDFGSKFNGCIGSRMTGAGFGGCCIAIVLDEQIPSFSHQLSTSYLAVFGIDPKIYATKLTDGVHELT